MNCKEISFKKYNFLIDGAIKNMPCFNEQTEHNISNCKQCFSRLIINYTIPENHRFEDIISNVVSRLY